MRKEVLFNHIEEITSPGIRLLKLMQVKCCEPPVTHLNSKLWARVHGAQSPPIFLFSFWKF